MIINVIYYVVSILSIFLFIVSVQFEKKKHILFTQSLASFCYFTAYLVLGAYSGCVIELIEYIKNIVFYVYESKNRKIPLMLLILFVSVLVVASLLTYDRFYSLFPLIINLAYFIASYFRNPKHIRIVMLVCGFIWAYYNFRVGAYIIIIGNILEIISAFISLIRYRDKNLEGE